MGVVASWKQFDVKGYEIYFPHLKNVTHGFVKFRTHLLIEVVLLTLKVDGFENM